MKKNVILQDTGHFCGSRVAFTVIEDCEGFVCKKSVKVPYTGAVEFGTFDGRFACRRRFYDGGKAFGGRFENVPYIVLFDSKSDALSAFYFWTDTTDLLHLT